MPTRGHRSTRLSRPSVAVGPVAVALATLLAGCDPVVDIQGSYFPAWIVCMVAGAILGGLSRLLLARADLEEHLGPLLLVYPSLWLSWTLLVWLIFYRT